MRTPLLSVIVLTLLALPLIAEDRAICAVCGPREGAGLEVVRATATWQGKHHYFCSLKCKIEFLKNPVQFLVTEAGTPAPRFELRTYEGSVVALEEYRGKVVLLDFWATFCPPCIEALPELQALHAKHGARGLAVVGVTVDDRPALVRKAVRRAGVTYPILQATSDVWKDYQVTALPSLILVGRDGNIIRRFGAEAGKEAMLAEIERALAAQ